MAELLSPDALLPGELDVDCAAPVDLRGFQGLSEHQAENFWIIDRIDLLECGAKDKKVRNFYRERDDKLAGVK